MHNVTCRLHISQMGERSHEPRGMQSHLDLVEYVPATDTTEATVKRQHSVGVVAYPGGSEGPPAVIQYSNAKTGDALSILLHLRDDRSSSFHH